MKPICTTAIALPVRQGYIDGSAAHLLVDANGVAIANLYGIETGLTLEQAKKSKVCAKGMEVAACLINAMNGHDKMVETLHQVAATSKQKRLIRLSNEALIAAGEMKE